MIIALINQKGGVGKSTLSVHLAAWIHEQGTKTALLDADAQASSTEWLKEAVPELPIFRLNTKEDVLNLVPKLATEFECLVIDGPGGLSEVPRAILFVSDVIFLACGPSLMDVRIVNRSIQVVKQVQALRRGLPLAVLVPNKLKIGTRLSRDLLETAKTLGIPSATGLKFREVYADAVGQGTVVWRMRGQSAKEAAQEMQILFEELLRYEPVVETPDERCAETA